MSKAHVCGSFEHAKKIMDALEVLNKDYVLSREQGPVEYSESKALGKIPNPQRIQYTIVEK